MTLALGAVSALRRHHRENLWLRDTLESVARELERMAANGQSLASEPS